MRVTIKFFSIVCLGLLLLTPHLAWSHADHGEPLNNEQAMKIATAYTQKIVENSELIEGVTLDASWQAVTEAKIHKKDLRYFIVSLYNVSQKKTLYVLLGSNGDFHDANFDGVFKGS